MSSCFDKSATYDKRTSVYHEKGHAQPKHIFKVLGDMIEARHPQGDGFSLLDVGGASGDFVHYLVTRFAGLEACCLDYSPDLIDLGRQRVPGANFVQGDARDLSMFEDGRFDHATMLGVISVFDDFAAPLDELVRVTADGGEAYIFSAFNDYPIDALVRWRYSGDDGDYNLGWNHFSKASVSAHLEGNPRVRSHRYLDFELPVDLPYREDDPIRSWTETGTDGGRVLKNGLRGELALEILCIET